MGKEIYTKNCILDKKVEYWMPTTRLFRFLIQ